MENQYSTALLTTFIVLPSQLSRFCGMDVKKGKLRPCPLRHNPSASLTATVVPDPAFAGAKLQWAYSATEVKGITLSARNTIGGVSNPSIVITPAALPSAKTVTLYVNVTQVRG